MDCKMSQETQSFVAKRLAAHECSATKHMERDLKLSQLLQTAEERASRTSHLNLVDLHRANDSIPRVEPDRRIRPTQVSGIYKGLGRSTIRPYKDSSKASWGRDSSPVPRWTYQHQKDQESLSDELDSDEVYSLDEVQDIRGILYGIGESYHSDDQTQGLSQPMDIEDDF